MRLTLPELLRARPRLSVGVLTLKLTLFRWLWLSLEPALMDRPTTDSPKAQQRLAAKRGLLPLALPVAGEAERALAWVKGTPHSAIQQRFGLL